LKELPRWNRRSIVDSESALALFQPSAEHRGMVNRPFSLEGKRILITGASSGIGQATARLVATLGASVEAWGRDEQRLGETLDSLPGSGHHSRIVDLTDAGAIVKGVEHTAPVDGLVHGAGIDLLMPTQGLAATQLRELMALNFESTVGLTQALHRQKKLARDAALVWVSSIASSSGAAAYGAYAASKAATEAFARSLAREWAPIRANWVEAGWVETPMTGRTARKLSVEALENYRQTYPLGFGQAEDVAGPIAFLLSPAARWITGTGVRVAGGA